MNHALNVAEAMIAAWLAQDWPAVTRLFTDQGSLVIVPTRQTYTGHKAIQGHLDEVASGIESLSFNTRCLQASNNIVTFERDDEFVYNGRKAKVPCVGIMEIDPELPKVVEWREYFDGMTMARAVGMKV
jgi:limonene-1,2-epoxide hydrolase